MKVAQAKKALLVDWGSSNGRACGQRGVVGSVWRVEMGSSLRKEDGDLGL